MKVSKILDIISNEVIKLEKKGIHPNTIFLETKYLHILEQEPNLINIGTKGLNRLYGMIIIPSDCFAVGYCSSAYNGFLLDDN